MTLSRVILCIERLPAIEAELLSSFSRRWNHFTSMLSSSDGVSKADSLAFHILYRDPEMLAVVKIVESALKEAGHQEIDVKMYGAGFMPAISDCFPQPDREDGVAVLLPGILPFLDAEECMQMLERHLKFRTHYSYSDTAVPGFFFDIISADLFEELGTEGMALGTIEALRSYCFRNIQDIDLDLHYATPDVRAFRLRMDCSDDRSLDRALRVLRSHPELRHHQLMDVVQSTSDLLGPVPSYLEIELTTEQSVVPTVYPVAQGDPLSLSAGDLDSILSSLKGFPFRADLTVALGGRGDPFAHVLLEAFVSDLSAIDAVKAIYIETPATDLSRKRLESVIDASKRKEFLTLIIRLPSLQASRYRQWMGSDRLGDVLSLLDSLVDQPLPMTVYVEMIRLSENEDELDAFMQRFSPERTGNAVKPLIGHYSRFGAILEERTAVDLSPLNRDYCRHLAFDLFVNARGEVPCCRQQLDGGSSLRGATLSSIFGERRGLHMKWMNGDYGGVLPACLHCDDWYVFNA